MYILWFNFILGLNVISLCFKLIVIHYHIPKQRKIKFNPGYQNYQLAPGFQLVKTSEGRHCKQ